MTAARTPEVGTRLTKEQAAEHYGQRLGQVWDEDQQRFVALGLAIREDAIRRGEDLEQRLDRMGKDRQIVLRFIATQLVEAEYDERKRPMKGRMHDYYTLPGYDKKTPTKQGGEKLAQFFNLRRAKTQTVERVCTQDFAMADVQVELVDKWGQPAGSGEAAATTAEASFQQAAVKYGARKDQQGKVTTPPDWRAAYNDVLARAGKRAFVQAVIYATATDDIFDASGAVARQAEDAGLDDGAPSPVRPRFPEKFGNLGGKYLDEVSPDELVKVAEWCRTKAKNPKAIAPILQSVEDELERRRLETEGETGELPF
jgi:hypothetical protein